MSEDQRRSRSAHLDAPEAVPHRVTVLGSFTLTAHGIAVPLGVDARRLVAYLAVHEGAHRRGSLAADLWPGVPSAAALRLLDEAVASVDVPGLVAGADDSAAPLSLAADVEVDLTDAMLLLRIIAEVPARDDVDLSLLRTDILPGWTASWIAVERERFRQLRLHAIEERARRLTAAGRFDDAVALARAAVQAAPSRESARRVLIEAHLAQGDVPAALTAYDDYLELLRSSVGGPMPFSLDELLVPAPTWPVMRGPRHLMPRSAVALPGLRSVRASGQGPRRLVSGGSVPRN